MPMSLHDVLRINLKAFDHMLDELGRTYEQFILHASDDRFRLHLAYLFSDAYTPMPVLDGGGRPYEPEIAKQVLVATALDIPISELDQVKAGGRNEFFLTTWHELKKIYWSRNWYNRETFALRMRPMLEGSRKSLEGFWLERAVRESLVRVAERLGITIDPKGDKPRRMKNRNVITLRGTRSTIRVQVKGVNSPRHHPERAKILTSFADAVAQDGDMALPILVGECYEAYDIPALRYIRQAPASVIEMGERLDELLIPMVSRLL